MASVTQSVPNYLGGISQQSEELLLPGQVLEALNAYPDPTLGLVKRTGLEYISDLRNTTNTASIVPSNILRSAKWFPIFLGPGANFFGCVAANTIRVWGSDGIERVVNTPGGTSYLSTIVDLNDVHTLTVNEFTFITNKLTKVTARAAPTFNANRVATVVISEVHYGAQYSLSFRLSGVTTTITYTTFNAEAAITTPAQTERTVTARQILSGLQALLPAGYSGTIIGNSMEIVRTTGTLDFQCTAAGALSGIGLFVFQDSISDVSRLPSKASNGRLVKINNTDAGEDDYYVRFEANSSGIGSGDGSWLEWIAPDVSPGLTNSTMPHLLTYNPSTGQFTFNQITWVDRLVGDSKTNPNPSVVDSTIQATFFYNNRLGFLTPETVVMSQTNDFYNLFANSAITSIDSDPIDRSVSSQSTILLSSVHPTTQGLILFGDNQQFLMQGESGVLTPSNSNIKSISNYQLNPDISPVDLGTTIGFASVSGAYSRFFEFLSRGQDEQPDIVELTKIVPEYLPNNINIITSSPQAGTVVIGTCATGGNGAGAAVGSSELFVLRLWTEGTNRSQAWTRWEFPEPILMAYLDQETLHVITDGNRTTGPDVYPLCRINLNQQSSQDSLVNYTFVPTGLSFTGKTLRAEPRIDYWIRIPPGDLVFDSTNNLTKVYLPAKYSPATPSTLSGNAYGLSNVVLTSNPVGNEIDAGIQKEGVTLQLQSGGAFNGRYFASVPGINLTATSGTVLYGYLYQEAIELPRIYFKTGADRTQSDYTATLTINRQRFVFGVTGPMQFLLRSRGRANFTSVQAVPAADYYIANSVPMADTAIYNLPIHQKNTNFSVRIESPTTFPMSLLSSSWEGNYAPRFYRRI